jgi:aldehyde dehydrogenase (NAD+)
MLGWKLGPALATGCTTIIKPSEETPMTALKIAELVNEAGIPAGVVNILPGFGDVGSMLAKHSDVDKVAFTGSTAVGYQIMRESHVNNLKRISLELGGKSANIIMDDADMELAIEQSSGAIFGNTG